MSKLIVIALAVLVSVVSGGVVQNGLVNVHRYYNNVDHFYTHNTGEIGCATQYGVVGKNNYRYERVSFNGYSYQYPGTVPLYRYYNGREHFYTTNNFEIPIAFLWNYGSINYQYQHIAAYVYPTFQNGLKPLYRYYNGIDHLYTTDSNEIGTITVGRVGKRGYRYEKIECYVR